MMYDLETLSAFFHYEYHEVCSKRQEKAKKGRKKERKRKRGERERLSPGGGKKE